MYTMYICSAQGQVWAEVIVYTVYKCSVQGAEGRGGGPEGDAAARRPARPSQGEAL